MAFCCTRMMKTLRFLIATILEVWFSLRTLSFATQFSKREDIVAYCCVIKCKRMCRTGLMVIVLCCLFSWNRSLYCVFHTCCLRVPNWKKHEDFSGVFHFALLADFWLFSHQFRFAYLFVHCLVRNHQRIYDDDGWFL